MNQYSMLGFDVNDLLVFALTYFVSTNVESVVDEELSQACISEWNPCFVVPVFSHRDDPIACLNKAMAFLTAIASSRFPTTNNQLRTSSNPRNQATTQDDRVTVQQVQGRQDNIIRDIWLGNALSQSDQGMLHDPGIPTDQAQTIIPHNAAFQTKDLNTYDSDCDDLSTAQVILMANISNYGSDVISEVPNSKTYLNDMDNQSMHALQDFEQSPVMDFAENEISMDVPGELPKVSLVNASLKKLKFHLTQFDYVVKKMTTPSALEEEVQIVFDQMEASVQQFSVDKKCLEIAKKEILLENDRLLQKVMSQDVLITMMNSMSLNNDYVNVKMQKCELCEKCLNLDAELSKSKQAYNDLLKNHSQLEKHCISLEVSMQLKQEVFQNDESCVNQNAVEIQEYFEINDLKARLQDKDTTISKLKDTIKSLKKNTKEKNVNHDKCDLNPINEELENSCSRLYSGILDYRIVRKHMTGNRSQLMNFVSKFLVPKDGLDIMMEISRLKFQKDHLCSACALGKSKKTSHQPKAKDTNQEKLYLLHMDLCGPMRVASINGKSILQKAFRIYNRRTQKIIETIHVTFDELTALASKQFCSRPGLQFQEAIAPRAVDLVDSLMSTSIDQDAPSSSTPSTQEQEQCPNIS
ncbi:hypothetical protein Tco_0588785 [Tanacetum coccineum]